MQGNRLSVAVVGAGYWGPNLVRNFGAHPQWRLAAVCDLDRDRAARLAGDRPGVFVTDDFDQVLARPEIDAVAIATPAATHLGLASQALMADKHVLVEKPLAHSVVAARSLVALATARGLVLMADHTYCYTPAVEAIRDLIASGRLGDVLFVDSVRINLGLVQPDVDVLWDLAPHDLSILDYVLPGGLRPLGVSAYGADPLGTGKACLGHLMVTLPHGVLAHVNVNWMSPTKIRQMVVGGSQGTLVFDDLNPVQRVTVYDRGVEMIDAPTDVRERAQRSIAYRVGDTWSPALPEREALQTMVGEFAASIVELRAPRTDGVSGLRILDVLEAAEASMRMGGATLSLEHRRPEIISVGALRRGDADLARTSP